MIFDSKKEPCSSIIESIICLYEKLEQPQQSNLRLDRNNQPCFYYEYPCSFFDGAALQNSCACGFSIFPVDGQVFDIYWNGGPGTNNKAEVMALIGLLSVSAFLGLQKLHIFGDSKLTIDHVLSKHIIKNTHRWLNRLGAMWSSSKDTQFPI